MSRQQRQRGRRRSQGGIDRSQLYFLGGGAAIVAIAVIAIVFVALNPGGAGEGALLDDGGHMLGPADAPVTVVEFSDFQ